jgi:hypothetical protein
MHDVCKCFHGEDWYVRSNDLVAVTNYVIPGKETQVCKLKRAHYGLKQSPKAWYSSIDAQICAQGLQRSNADNNLYFTHATNGRIAILLLYGNDIYLTGDYAEKINII